MSDQDQLPAMDPEQAAELNALKGLVAVQEEEAATEQTQEPESKTIALAAEIGGLLAMMVGVASPMFPSLEQIYTPEVCEKVGNALEPVCMKHGWLQGGIGGEYKEEIMALCVIGPLAFATYKGVQGDIAARQPAKQIEAAAMPLGQRVGTTPDGKEDRLTVTIGKVEPNE